MQLIDRKKLFALIEDRRLEESSDKFSYTTFVDRYLATIAKNKKSGTAKFYYAYFEMNKWLKRFCPPIQFVGKGSSRIAYAMSGGKCLKMASCDKGVGQNKQEIQNMTKDTRLCFPRIYEWDDKTYGSLLTECCSRAKDADFMKMFKIDVDGVTRLLTKFAYLKDFDKVIDETKEDIQIAKTDDDREYVRNLENRIKFVKKLKSRKEMKYKVMWELFELYLDDKMRDELLISDLSDAGNWGLAIRDGEICMVVIDAGFSDNIAKRYYY